MTTINIINNFTLLYIILTLLCLYFIIMYNKEFSMQSLVDSFIYLSNKLNLIILFLTFLFMFIFELLGYHDAVIIFFRESINGILYFSMFTYTLFFGIKLTYWVKSFSKDADLFGFSYINKGMKGDDNK